MKNYLSVLMVLFVALLCTTSCGNDGTETFNKDDIINVETRTAATGPGLGKRSWRLKRAKHGCNSGFSICALYQRKLNGIALVEGDLSINHEESILTVIFTEEFDSEGLQEATVDEGFNYIDVDQEMLDIIGVNAIYMHTGVYPLFDVNIPEGQFGTLQIPIILE